MDELDDYGMAKMEIRGLLISNKEGCCLTEFKKQYRSMLGQTLPFAQFGYKSDIDFLRAMPDVVQISSIGRDYHLFGIADAKSKHIQKMVAKQKPSKKKPLGRLNPIPRVNPRMPPRPPPSALMRSYDLPPPSFTTKRSYVVPPRFQANPKVKKELPTAVMNEIVNLLCQNPTGLSLRDVLVRYRQSYNKELSFKEYGFFTLQECLEKIPSLILKPKDNDTFVLCSPETAKSYSESLKMKRSVSRGKSMDEYADASQNTNVLQGHVGYIDCQYFENKNKSSATNGVPNISRSITPTVHSSEGAGFSFTTAKDRPNFELPSNDLFSFSDYPSEGYSFTTAIDRPNGELPCYDPPSFLDYPSGSSNHFYPADLSCIPSPRESTININDYGKYSLELSSFQENHNTSNRNMKANHLDDLSFNMRESSEGSTASEIMRDNLMRVVENCPHGIWARDFPALYKDVTRTEFDLHSLGFYDLASFIDSVPDILTRRSLPNSRKDYLIYPAGRRNEMDRDDPKSAAFAIEIIIGNTRKILQANDEGITLKEFLYVYSLNCSEPLYFVDLGFDSLENLLLAIADRVPLKFEMNDGVKSVHLVLPEVKSLLPSPVDLEPLPPGIVSPFEQFTQQTLHNHIDFDQFFPVYVSSVINPEHIYIQLEDTNEELVKKYQELEKFYTSQNKSYLMKDTHIAAGSIGVALWPEDMHWYRIRIMSVISPETVRVFYVDYGTIEIIPKSLLRYLREEFFDLPTQAIKASLAYVKPPLADNTWNPKAKTRILELCMDITIMTKIHRMKQDGLLSVVLCDTNGAEDVFINDVLINEHLARAASDANNSSHCRSPQERPQCLGIPPPSLPASNLPTANASQPLPPPIQTTDPTQVIGMLLQAYSSLAVNKASPTATPNLPMDPAFVTAIAQAAQNLSQNSFTCADFSKQFHATSTPVATPIPGPKPPVNENWQYPPTSLDLPGETASCSSYTPTSEDSSEVFDDDVDAFFDEFYQKVSLVTKRYVKRIRTGDGYMFHILIYESKPFVSCGDICNLIWYNKDSDYLLQRLQNRESTLPNTLICENKNEDMFDQLRKFHVQGFKERNGQTCVLSYPLNTLVQILNIFGHPSAELRSRVLSESSSFNAKHPMWMELSEVEIPDGEEEFAGKTDDDKLNRLCLYDLQIMKQGIRIRRQNLDLRRSKSPEEVLEEEEKLRLLYSKVIDRIKEIQQICSNFTDA